MIQDKEYMVDFRLGSDDKIQKLYEMFRKKPEEDDPKDKLKIKGAQFDKFSIFRPDWKGPSVLDL